MLLAAAWLLILSCGTPCTVETEYIPVLENVSPAHAAAEAERAFSVLVDWTEWSLWNSFWISNAVESPAKGARVSILVNGTPPLWIPFEVVQVDFTSRMFCWRVCVPWFQPAFNVLLRTGRCTSVVYDGAHKAISVKTVDPHSGLLAYPICMLKKTDAEQRYRDMALDLKAWLQRALPRL